MRVCLIASCPLLGGAERVLLEAIDVLRDEGIDCRVLLPGDGEFADELRQIGVPFGFLRKGAWVSWSRLSVYGRMKALINIIVAVIQGINKVATWRCNVIYTNTLTLCYGSIVARSCACHMCGICTNSAKTIMISISLLGKVGQSIPSDLCRQRAL